MPRSVLVFASIIVGAGCAAASGGAARSSTMTRGTPAGFFWVEQPVGKRHTLMPTAKTVVVGGYDADATPVLRIASGDEVEIGAVSTCAARLLQPGKDTGSIEPAYREINAAIRDSTLRRGPGGHILTGPIFIEGAEPGDVLEVRIKRVDMDIPYACNSFGPRSGFMPEEFPGVSKQRIVPLDREKMIGHFSDSLGIEIPLNPFFGSMGVPCDRAHQQRAANDARRKSRQQGAGCRHDSLHPGEGARRTV